MSIHVIFDAIRADYPLSPSLLALFLGLVAPCRLHRMKQKEIFVVRVGASTLFLLTTPSI
ncbi:MAG: hypothetical protein ACOVSW_14020 [Candidatus Kapaibacteriota bacterium]|jgi:hypothetical protein